MSQIDSYRHTLLGMIDCPAHCGFKLVALYRLDEDALRAETWQARRGDLLLGGGSGEAPALHIAMPEAVYWFTHQNWDAWESLDEIFKAYWPMNAAYCFGTGYVQLGWDPQVPIEIWLTEHVLAFVFRKYPDLWGSFRGPRPLQQDGSICRVPSNDEREIAGSSSLSGR